MIITIYNLKCLYKLCLHVLLIKGRGSMDDTFTWDYQGAPSIFTTDSVGSEVNNGLVDAVYHGM